MLSWTARLPRRTKVASLETIFYDGGQSSVTFKAKSDPYLVINQLPPAPGVNSAFNGIPRPSSCALDPPVHWHAEQEERFHVLEGRADFYLEGKEQLANVDDVIMIPKQAFHTFRNASSEQRLVIQFVLDPANRERDEAFFSTANRWTYV
jgi:mannose-6-phosphate isomerase-like protein (cupin superfamily)